MAGRAEARGRLGLAALAAVVAVGRGPESPVIRAVAARLARLLLEPQTLLVVVALVPTTATTATRQGHPRIRGIPVASGDRPQRDREYSVPVLQVVMAVSEDPSRRPATTLALVPPLAAVAVAHSVQLPGLTLVLPVLPVR